VFRLPFYELLQTSVTLLSALALMLVLMTYLFFGAVLVKDSGKIAASDNASRHLSGLLFIWWPPGDGAFTSVTSNCYIRHRASSTEPAFTADHVTRFALWVDGRSLCRGCLLLALNFVRPKSENISRRALAATWRCGLIGMW